MTIADLIIKMSLDGRGVKRGADQAALDFKRIEKQASTTANVFKGLGKFLAFGTGLSIGAGVTSYIKRLQEYSSQILKLHNETGESTDDLQRWDYAAMKTGRTLGDVLGELKKLPAGLTELEKGVALSKKFGDNFEKAAKEAKDLNVTLSKKTMANIHSNATELKTTGKQYGAMWAGSGNWIMEQAASTFQGMFAAQVSILKTIGTAPGDLFNGKGLSDAGRAAADALVKSFLRRMEHVDDIMMPSPVFDKVMRGGKVMTVPGSRESMTSQFEVRERRRPSLNNIGAEMKFQVPPQMTKQQVATDALAKIGLYRGSVEQHKTIGTEISKKLNQAVMELRQIKQKMDEA